MKRPPFLTTSIVLLAAQFAGAAPPAKSEPAIEKTADAVVVRSNGQEGQEIVRFQMRQPEGTGMLIESAAYFHPLRTPAGTVVTALAPTAHKYYRGVFMAYVVMHGEKDADFWGWGGVVPRKDRKIINKAVSGLTGGMDGRPASFRAKNEWLAEGVTMVKEDLQVEIGVKGAANVLDLVYALTAEADTRLAQFTVGGLGLSVRTDSKLEAQGPDGPVNLPSSTLKLGTDWPAAAWYGYTLTLPDETKVGTAVIGHPENPETLWHLSLAAKVINPCITAPREVVLKANVPLTLRYRVIAQDGPLSRDLVNELAAEWAGPNLKAAPSKRIVPMGDGLSPQEAAAAMTVPDGFRVQLAAGEPLVHQPIAFTIDAKGRLWVAEAYTYPTRAKEGEGKDKIIILEDTDGDGAFEKRKVFIEGLNLVSGLELGFGGVWVGAAPYLMFIPDRDGDDVPDVVASPPLPVSPSPPLQILKDVPPGATVLLDGFGWQDTHETLNAFIWGPDGWLYGCHGVFTHSKVGKPGTKDESRQGLNAGVWRYHPTRHEFEVFAHGTSNPWGVDFDDHGQAFITACVIPHLWHVIQGGRYQRQAGQHFNPYTFEDIKTIADHLHYVGRVGQHAWRGDHNPRALPDTLAAGGGHAHCGAMIYLGDNFPPQYRNQIFMDNIHGNRLNVCRFDRAGSGFIGRRAPDFLIANDHWFRGINLKYGPDGSVYLIDWYDKQACHLRNPEIWDRTNGRVYNVKYTGARSQESGVRNQEPGAKGQAKVTDLTKLSDAELVKLHAHENEWYVRMARRILQERAEAVRHAPPNAGISATQAQTPGLLMDFFRQAPDVTRKLRALWTLHAMFGVPERDRDEMRSASGPDSEYIRAWVIQLDSEQREVHGNAWKGFVDMASSADEQPLVRLALASALQRLPLDKRWEIAAGLLSHAEDANDHNLPLMYWYGIEPLVAADPERANTLAKGSKIEQVVRFIVRRAASTNETMNAAVAWLASASDTRQQQMLLDEMRLGLEGRVNIPQPSAWAPAYGKLLTSNDAAVRAKADQIAVALGDKRILPRMRNILADTKASVEERQRALDLLIRGRDMEAAPAVRVALNEAALRGPAIRALAAYDDADTSPAILALYAKLNEAEKRDAINTLVARPGSANKLFHAIDKGDVPRTDVHAYHVQQLLGFKDETLAKRITSVWGEIRATARDKLEFIAQHKAALTSARLKSADLSNGRRLFAKTCSACHVLFGEGGKIGPDITGSNRANLDYLLENVLDPSAIVGKDYLMTVVVMTDGRVVSGLIQQETDSAVTLRTINDTVVVAKTDIDQRKLSELSLMPEGQLHQLTPDEQRDLIAYLGMPHQVALRGREAPLDPQTLVQQVVTAAGGEDKLLKLFQTRERLNVSSDPEKMGNERVSVHEPPMHWWLGKKDRVKEQKEPATFLVWAWTLGALTDPASKVEAIPEITESDRPALGLRVSGTIDPPMDIFFDEAESRLVRIDWRGDIHRFSDWKEHEGFKYPAKCVGYKKSTGKPWYFSEIIELQRLKELPNGIRR